jgi:hypothetical protein
LYEWAAGLDYRICRTTDDNEKLRLSEEAFNIVEEGMNLAYICSDLRQYSNFFSLKAGALEGLGKRDEAREASKKVVLFHYILDGHSPYDYKMAMQLYKDEYGGEDFDLASM